MAEDSAQLTRSMEDYLEAIYNLKARSNIARVKDIASEMAVKMPSVTGALRSLVDKGLVTHRPYESVELTEEGLKQAREVARRHTAIKGFLVNTLGLHESDAEAEACSIEHAIRPDTLDRLLAFVESVQPSAVPADNHPRGHHGHWHGHLHGQRLSGLQAGARGRIAHVHGCGPVRKRLMEMGLTPGTDFEVVRHAPLGDPVELKLRGYCLSLRKSEAEGIEVECGS
jgi:DtxR family transcriptional regulator, Mn-dependent transcriptional regulator